MPTTELARYCAYAADDQRAHGHAVEAASFADAALQFVEVWHREPDDDRTVRIIVLDEASGEQQCFVVELDGAAAHACEPEADVRLAASA